VAARLRRGGRALRAWRRRARASSSRTSGRWQGLATLGELVRLRERGHAAHDGGKSVRSPPGRPWAPEEAEAMAAKIWQQREDLSDLDSDVLDAIAAAWLERGPRSAPPSASLARPPTSPLIADLETDSRPTLAPALRPTHPRRFPPLPQPRRRWEIPSP